MKTLLPPARKSNGGYAVALVLVLSAAALLVLSGALSWCATNTTMTERNNQYYRTVAAAEAATEKVISRVANDYQNYGDALVTENLPSYRQMVPTSGESSAFANYEFKNGQNHVGQTYIEFVPPYEFRVLSSQYRGLRGYASAYRIVSNARELNSRFDIVGAIRQDIEVATIPVFQFAIFYTIDLEINPGPVMTVTGPVHCNSTLYIQPQNVLTFQSDVTAAGAIVHNKKPGDPLVRTGGTIVYQSEHDGGVSTMNLPIGTNNSSTAVRQVVEIPPGTEAADSLMGRERYYNKADLIISVTDAGVIAKSGLYNNFATVVPAKQVAYFLDTTKTFYNKRENKTVKLSQIDVGKLSTWNNTNTLLRPIVPTTDIRTVYISDTRSQTSSTESGIRMVNGQTLLNKGLTVATPNPLYVQGHYNCPAAALGTANTINTKPASLVGDAITVLSPSWNDANASSGLSSRIASSTTVNAAFLSGIVETASNQYSGGVENYPRFLEDWGGKTLTYNGSMVVMFPSRYATGLWRGTGSTIGIYNPPARNWAFDQNFKDITKVPPASPSVRVLIRGTWTMIQPNSVSAAAMAY